MQVIDPRELNDLAAFATRGGLGRGVATTDCIAEQPDQLMYLSGDSLILLRELGPIVIASCEGVVGWVKRDNVEFERIASSSSPTSSKSVTPDPALPRTVVHSPSPPMSIKNLPTPVDHTDEDGGKKAKLSAEPVDDKRASNPFDLESPLGTPGVDATEKGFNLPVSESEGFVGEVEEMQEVDEEDSKRMSMASDNSSSFGGIGGFMLASPSPPASVNEHGVSRGMWGSSPGISEMADSPITPISSLSTSHSVNVKTPSTPFDLNDLCPTSIKSHATAQSSTAWDIYDSYSRESMYGKRASSPPSSTATAETSAALPPKADWLTPERLQRQSGQSTSPRSRSSLSSSPNGSSYRNSMISNSSWDDEGRAFEAARLALQRVGAGKRWADAEDGEEEEKATSPENALSPVLSTTRRGSALENDISRSTSPNGAPPRPARRRQQGVDSASVSPNLSDTSEVPQPALNDNPETPKAAPRASSPPSNPLPSRSTPPRSILSAIEDEEHRRDSREKKERNAFGSIDGPLTPPRIIQREMDDDTPKRLRIANPDSDDEDDVDGAVPSAGQSSDGNHTSQASTTLVTPVPPTEGQLPEHPSSPTRQLRQSPQVVTIDTDDKNPLLDSPLSMKESPRGKVQPIVATMPTSNSIATISLRSPPTAPGPPRRVSPAMASTATFDKSPMRPPATPWQTDSPSSPHSIEATRQAVEVVRKTPEAKRSRGLTLVGRMEADLGQSKGPVPITFIVGDALLASTLSPTSPPLPSSSSLGLGLPRALTGGTNSGRISPGIKKSSSVQSTLASPLMDIDDPIRALKTTPSAYPSMRSATNPLPPAAENTSIPSTTNGMPKPGFFPRPRSRSFSAAVSKVIAKKSGPGLTIQTTVPSVPSITSPPPKTDPTVGVPAPPVGLGKRPFFSRQSSLPQASLAPATSHPSQPPTPVSPAITLSPDIIGFLNHANESNSSLAPPPASARSSSFSFRLPRGSKTSLLTPTSANNASLASPVSNKDYEDTVKADGLDFEIIQPKSKRIGSTLSPSSSSDDNALLPDGADLERKGTVHSSTSGRSLRTLPDTDEWGFIKDRSPTPEVFMGRAGGAGQRALEQKWLGIINTPLAGNGGPPKKVRKLAIESGIPASLRGRVWAWFMAPTMSARRPGLYQELLDHDREDKRLAERIDSDVESAYPDHSIYSETSTGQTDLRSILRAYSHFATGGYRPEMSLIAGMLLIHCVAEDAFWLLSGFVNGSLRDYYASPTGVSGGKAVGMRIDAAVFAGVLAGSEPKLGKLFRDIGLHPIVFLEEWYAKLFLRCLPWPTALRIIDAVVAEGPRFLLIASLTILTLSRDRILALPRTYTDVLAYLRDLPQDALLLPEGFMKACENVRFKEDDMKRLRAGVEKELGLVVG